MCHGNQPGHSLREEVLPESAVACVTAALAPAGLNDRKKSMACMGYILASMIILFHTFLSMSVNLLNGGQWSAGECFKE